VARTRAQRRRQTLYLTIALVLTLLVLLFARDVSRSAHGSIGPRRSENRSFGSLANSLVSQENTFDGHLSYLLAHGTTLTRPVFAARLDQLGQQLPLWTIEAEQLRRPKLAHNINDVVAAQTDVRIDAYRSLLWDVASSLTLPWPALPASSAAITNPAQTLISTSQQWGLARFSLVQEPGLVTLLPLTTLSATFDRTTGLTGLYSSTSLALARGIGIVAVGVSPSPLPAAHGVLLLPPGTSMHLGVSIRNAGWVTQAVRLRMTLTPAHGPVQSQSFATTLGPLQAYAFSSLPFTTAPSERGTLVLSLTGARAASNMTRSRTYLLKMSPSGNG
jgi:hypothetical protein